MRLLDHGILLNALSRPVIKTYMNTLLHMDVEQKTTLTGGAKIIAANHPSFCDPFIMAALLPQRSYILITDVVFQVPVLSGYLRRLGHIPVKAGSGQQAVDTALQHLAVGHTIVIFPEGKNSPVDGGYEKEHTGVARLAIGSGAPVYPVGIYLQRDLIQSTISIVEGKTKPVHWYFRGPYAVTIGNPMEFSGDGENRDYVKEVAHQIMLKIMRLAAESQKRWNINNPPIPGALEIP